MVKCGLLGRKLGHSYSPAIHASLGDYSYSLWEKEPEELEAFLKDGDFTGLNVTIPYKKSVIPYLDALSDTAEKLGAVNTVIRREGKTIGHNTDWFGFHAMVARSGLDVRGKKALVLGSGGASNTAVAVLASLGAVPVVISRTGENHYGNLERHRDARILVNATPVGMYPNNGVSPVQLDAFPALEGVLDTIYNPARTRLLLDAQERGLVTENGLWMLIAQAKESAEWFTGQKLPDSCIGDIHRKLKGQTENIILIGMPGCGKTTVAGILGQKLGRKVVDSDREIETRAGRTIPEIFAREGEMGFRARETEVLAALGRESGLVIATGGGCVTREENFPLLRQNGRLFRLQRDLEKLPTEGRPLSKAGELTAMYNARNPMYQRFAQHTVSNNGCPEATAEEILKILGETE